MTRRNSSPHWRGIRARVALSGEEALQALDSEAAHVVVLDVLLPGMGGLEVLKRIRQAQGGASDSSHRAWQRPGGQGRGGPGGIRLLPGETRAPLRPAKKHHRLVRNLYFNAGSIRGSLNLKGLGGDDPPPPHRGPDPIPRLSICDCPRDPRD